MNKICHSILKISEKVTEAIAHHKPIVALESTIISHGMPYPQNKQCAISIQQKISQQGAVPATIAIFDGKIHVGLDANQIQRLAFTGSKVKKVSRRDLAYIIANKGIGATTVSGTMIAAYSAGLQMFVTGGIGGVHRGYQNTMDVSADLEQLARTPVTVVSAGVKSILDIGRTLQYLQTKGVPVLTYKNKYFPAFFSASSGLLSPFVLDSQKEAANIIYAHQQLGLQNGMLIGVPNNNPAQGQQIEKAIQMAIKESEQEKIKGASITPFLLKRVNQLTKGASLKSNISLVLNNAEVGARISVELANLKKQSREKLKNIKINVENSNYQPKSKGETGKLIAIGGSAIDYQIKPKSDNFQMYKSCIGKTRRSLGGIARNIVDCSSKLGIQSVLISAIGNDRQSDMITQFCKKKQIQLIKIQEQGIGQKSSGKYYAILDKENNQIMGISQMQINEILTFDHIHSRYLKHIKKQISKNDIVVIDSNVPQEELYKLVKFIAQQVGCMIVFECKGQKTKRVITSGAYSYISLLKMNFLQSKQIEKAVKTQHNLQNINLNDWMIKNLGSKNPHVSPIKTITTNGPEKIIILKSTQNKKVETVEIKALKPKIIQKTTGAGDTFTATYCSMILMGKSYEEALKYALAGSKLNIQSVVNESVISDKISVSSLQKIVNQELINI